jgi:hypothetical protein
LINISDFFVDPAHRGQGIGRMLLDAIFNEAAATECCKLTLEVQENNSQARLSLYTNNDRRWIQQLSTGSIDEKAEAVRQAAHGFSISRNFPKCELDGAAKHVQTVEQLNAIKPDDFGGDISALVLDLEKRFVETHQSKRMMLSAASKLLWGRYPGRSVIVDNHAAKVLGFPAVNLSMYRDYVLRWQQRYAEVKSRVVEAVDALLKEDGLVPVEIAADLSTEWFRQRAFDLYLWQTGAP